MADDTSRNERAGEQQRQGVREPQPADLGSRREFGAADMARANEERGVGEPRKHGEGEDRESGGMLGRMKEAWHRMRHRA